MEPPPPSECRAERILGSRFSHAESSLVFISCCFALSLSGVLILVAEAAEKGEYQLLSWGVLASYLTFIVWRQYSLYYIPLQVFRNHPESESEEATTLTITLFLFVLSVTPIRQEKWTHFLLLLVIAANTAKVQQMKVALQRAPNKPAQAIRLMNIFIIRLALYFILLLIGTLLLMQHGHRFGKITYALMGGVIPIIAHLSAQWFLENLVPRYYSVHALTPSQYVESLSVAWERRE